MYHIVRMYVKLLLRNRLVQLYFLVLFIVILYLQLQHQSNIVSYAASGLVSLASFIPYLNVYLFNLFQVIPLVFLAVAYMERGWKIDSMDTISYRPQSNTAYVWGMCIAFVLVFSGVAILTLLPAIVIHLWASEAPFRLWIYAFYFFTLVLPSIIFVLGSAWLLVNKLRHRVLSILILLGCVVVLSFGINEFQSGVFDPLGNTLPAAFSDITGHPDLRGYLLQRGCWLFLGMSFIQWTILCFFRLPNTSRRIKPLVGMLVNLAIALGCGFTFVFLQQTNLSSRRDYQDMYKKYATVRHGTLVAEEISFKQQENKMFAKANMVIVNQTSETLDSIILYLNPALRITAAEINGRVLTYKREQQVIVITESLAAGGKADICFVYEGTIDENICYPEMPENVIIDSWKRRQLTCRYGQHYAFLSEDYTLLIPEALWYPATLPPVNLHSPYNTVKNFTQYTLTVVNPERKTVLSQGERHQRGDTIVFTNEQLLPGLSLCIGNYASKTVRMDSICYELYMFRDNIALLEHFDWWCDKIALNELITDLNENVERQMRQAYPYHHFILAETPISFTSYFRNAEGTSGYVQPEIVFLSERGIGVWPDFKYVGASEVKKKLQYLLMNTSIYHESFSLRQFLKLPIGSISSLASDVKKEGNPYSIVSSFYNNLISIQSADYPIINHVLWSMAQVKKEKTTGNSPEENKKKNRAIHYLRKHSLKDVLEDETFDVEIRNEIVRLKSIDLIARFNVNGIASDSLTAFIDSFLEKYQHQLVDFTEFNRLFIDKYHVDWQEILAPWFTANRLPRFLIKDLSARSIKEKFEQLGYHVVRIEASVFNDSEVDGIVSLQTSNSGADGIGSSLSLSNGSQVEYLPAEHHYLIPAGTGKNIVLIEYRCLPYITLGLNLSENIPDHLQIQRTSGIRNVPTDSFIRELDRKYFLEEPGEIIVDNEDSNFVILQSSSRLRLQAAFNKKLPFEEKYINLTSLMSPNESWQFYIEPKAFGRTIRSAVLRKAGEGKANIEWHASIDKEGEYEVFVYLPNTVFSLSTGFWISPRTEEALKDTQTYIVSYDDNEEEISINVFQQQGWISLGRFYYTPGNYKVSLSGKGQPEQLIVGDAVKWKYCGE